MRQAELLQLAGAIEKPARYVGGEYGSILPKPQAELRFLLAYPDLYEVGMSYLGLQILYSLINSIDAYSCERVFAPWPDYQRWLRDRGEPLRALESGRTMAEFDVVGFSLQHELAYTNMLLMLDQGGLPLRCADRSDSHPLVIAGGPCAASPEPVADFVDGFLVGDGEESVLQFLSRAAELKREGAHRESTLCELARLPGLYVPRFYEARNGADGRFEGLYPNREGIPPVVERQAVNLEKAFVPTTTIVPNLGAVHDRLTIEIKRGCTRGCRFCQAGYMTRPNRERYPETAAAIAQESLQQTGFDQLTLLSLSTGDYSALSDLVGDLMVPCEDGHVALALPSLRADGFDPQVAQRLAQVKRTGLTFAPEVASERLRRVINKDVTPEAILSALEGLEGSGYDLVKFYFMVGLPTETQDDLEAIVDLVGQVWRFWDRNRLPRRRINVSLAGFIPKPHTPFQWVAQEERDILREKMQWLKEGMESKRKKVHVHYSDERAGLLEAVFARGDRKLGAVIERAYRSGCQFDAWNELFSFELWMKAFEELGIDPEYYANRERPPDEVFPWDIINVGISKEFLKKEYEKALAGQITEDCRTGDCYACGLPRGKTCHDLAATRTPEAAPSRADARQKESRPFPVSEEPAVYRLRYSKTGGLVLVSHLDLIKLIDQIIRRASLKSVLTQGYNPKPKRTFCDPLPVGMASQAELVDLHLYHLVEGAILVEWLNRFVLPGLRFLGAERLPEGAPGLPAPIGGVGYRVELRMPDDQKAGTLRERLAAVRRGEAFEVVHRSRKSGRCTPVNLADRLLDAKDVFDKATRLLRIELTWRVGTGLPPLSLREVLRALWAEAEGSLETLEKVEAYSFDELGSGMKPLVARRVTPA